MADLYVEPPISVEELTNLLIAANPALPDTDEVAHAYECLADAEAAMPVVAAVWPLAVAEGWRQAGAAAAVVEAAKAWAARCHREPSHPDHPNVWGDEADFALLAAVDELEVSHG